MKMLIPNILYVVLSILIVTPCHAQWNYPPTKTVDAADTYFGKTYPDPYRWLENMKDKDVEAWFKAQAELTDGLLAKIPGRDALVQEWLALDKLKPAVYSAIAYENGRVFYKKTLAGENVGKLYFRQGWEGAEKLLFDPAAYKTRLPVQAGMASTIQSIVPSWDGKYVAMGFSSGGAEWSEVRVLDVERGTLLPEIIYPSLGAYGWLRDNKSFFYDSPKVTDIKSMEILLNRRTKVHKLGTDIAADTDVFSNESYPELGITAKEGPCAFIDESYPDYIIGFVGTAQREMRLFYAPVAELKHKKIKWNHLCERSDNLVSGWGFSGWQFFGDYVYATSHNGAPKYKLVRTNVKHPDWEHAETVIPEMADSIQSITKSRVREWHCCHSLPSEPDVKVSLHPAQAAPKPRITEPVNLTVSIQLHDDECQTS